MEAFGFVVAVFTPFAVFCLGYWTARGEASRMNFAAITLGYLVTATLSTMMISVDVTVGLLLFLASIVVGYFWGAYGRRRSNQLGWHPALGFALLAIPLVSLVGVILLAILPAKQIEAEEGVTA